MLSSLEVIVRYITFDATYTMGIQRVLKQLGVEATDQQVEDAVKEVIKTQ